MRDEPQARVMVPNCVLSRHHKGRRFIKTAGRWPRKSASAKKCVTTYLPNESAPKMDGAQAYYKTHRYLVNNAWMELSACNMVAPNEILLSRRKRDGCGERLVSDDHGNNH